MKKIIGLTIGAILILGLVGLGTWAFFGDTETSTGSLTAGKLDLQVEGQSIAASTFSASNIMPGQSNSGSTTITNNGTVSGNFSVESGTVTNTESPEGSEFHDTDNGVYGELGGEIKIALYIDANGNGIFDGSDIGLKNDNTTYAPSSPLDFQIINNYDTKSWTDISTLAAAESVEFHVDWQFPNAAYDQSNCQGDNVSLDFNFILKQL